jgi:hypothetical protein
MDLPYLLVVCLAVPGRCLGFGACPAAWLGLPILRRSPLPHPARPHFQNSFTTHNNTPLPHQPHPLFPFLFFLLWLYGFSEKFSLYNPPGFADQFQFPAGVAKRDTRRSMVRSCLISRGASMLPREIL